jgi:prepilin peptidase CpaA
MLLYFYILISIIGIASSYTDIYERKIRNRHLLIITCLALLAYIVFFYTGTLKFSLNLFLNPLMGLLIGFILYLSGLWKAGDAKLFATYSLLLPVNHYQVILPLSCLSLFVNIFMISFIIILLPSLCGIINNRSKIIKKVISKETALYFTRIFFILLGISWIIQPLLAFSPLKDNTFFSFIILYLGFSLLLKSIKKIRKTYILVSCVILGLILRYLLMPEFFSFVSISAYMRSILIYSGIFYILQAIVNEKNERMMRIPFAPFMFVGALLTNTPFLLKVMRLFISIRG